MTNLIVYLVLAALATGVALMLTAFTYPEVLYRGGKGFVRLLIRMVRFLLKIATAGEKRAYRAMQNMEKSLFGRPIHPRGV